MDTCDCNMPSCMGRFERSAKSQIEYCGADKELYYEWLDIIDAEYAEEHSLADYDAKALEEIIKNPNEW